MTFRLRYAAALIAVLVLYGLAGQADYESARFDECQAQGLDYNAEADLCKFPAAPAVQPQKGL